MPDWITDGLKVFVKITAFCAVLFGLAICAQKQDEKDCIEKGKALGAKVKFYHDRCYVRGYSDGN